MGEMEEATARWVESVIRDRGLPFRSSHLNPSYPLLSQPPMQMDLEAQRGGTREGQCWILLRRDFVKVGLPKS